MADEEDCDDDSKCTDNGICSFGKCQCTGTYLHIRAVGPLSFQSNVMYRLYAGIYLDKPRYNMQFGFRCSDLTHEPVWSFQFINQNIKNGLVGTYLVTSNKVYQSVLKMLKFEKVTWAGPNCTTHNHLYFHSFSLVFYGLMTVSFIQLFFCIRKDTQSTVITLKLEGQRN